MFTCIHHDAFLVCLRSLIFLRLLLFTYTLLDAAMYLYFLSCVDFFSFSGQLVLIRLHSAYLTRAGIVYDRLQGYLSVVSDSIKVVGLVVQFIYFISIW